MNATSKAYVYLSVTALFWGGNSVAGKMAVGHISPMLLTSLRWVFALCVILAFMTPQIRRDWAIIRKHWPKLAFYGAFGFTLFNVLLYSALQYTSAINAVIEQAGIPMVIFVLNFLLFRIPASPAQIVGYRHAVNGFPTVVEVFHPRIDSAVRLHAEFVRGEDRYEVGEAGTIHQNSPENQALSILVSG